MSALRVKNWQRFQHYKDRNPPWIKLHHCLLSSRDWVALDDASRVLAIACMLIASQNEGQIPDDPDYIKRVAYLNGGRPDFNPLISCGFLEPLARTRARAVPSKKEEAEAELQANASKLLASASSIGAVAKATRTERDEKFEQFWKEYPKREGSNPKIPARAKFLAAVNSGVDPEAIITGLRGYATELQATNKVGTGFVAMAVTWLNQQRWGDYAAPAPEIPSGIPPDIPPERHADYRRGWRPGMRTSEEILATCERKDDEKIRSQEPDREGVVRKGEQIH